MAKIAIFMAEGCEEIEGLTVVDLLRRAKIDIDMVSITEEKRIIGSHGIAFDADLTAGQADFASYDGVVLPGGLKGTQNLKESALVNRVIKEFAASGKLVSAICAAPSVLGQAGLLQGKKATSYPGFADQMTGCTYLKDAVVRDGSIITSRGMGTAIAFGLAIVAYYSDAEAAEQLAQKIMYGI